MAKVTITIEDDPNNPEGAKVTTEFDDDVDPASEELTVAQNAGFAVMDFLQQCESSSYSVESSGSDKQSVH